MNLTTATPIEFDTELARLWNEKYAALNAVQSANDAIHYAAEDRKDSRRGWGMTDDEARHRVDSLAMIDGTYRGKKAGEASLRLSNALDALVSLQHAIDEMDREFIRRGGWTRAFLVTSSEGHVHSSMNCSTCNYRTTFAWMVDYSGKDEAEIVEFAGERACTVCYPTAPVDVLARPTRMFSQDEIVAQKAREEREAAKAAREAKRLEKALLPDGSTLKVGTERFTTLASARTWLTDAYWWGLNHPSFPESAVQTVAEAVAAKEGKSAHMVRTEAEIRALKRK